MVELPWASVVIPTYGEKGIALTRTCIESLLVAHAHLPPEIFVVSDGDEPEIFERLTEALRPLSSTDFAMGVIHAPRKGFAHACNVGIRQCNGAMGIFLVNNDIEFIEPSLQFMADAMHNTRSGVVGCRLLYPNMTIQHAGVAYVPLPPGSPTPGYFDHYLRNESAYHYEAVTMANRFVTGALMGLSRGWIDANLELDERFGFTGEDVDVCLRSMEAGLKVLYLGYTAAIHHEGASRGATLEEKMRLAPDVAMKEAQSLHFLFQKWAGYDFQQIGASQE